MNHVFFSFFKTGGVHGDVITQIMIAHMENVNVMDVLGDKNAAMVGIMRAITTSKYKFRQLITNISMFLL